MSATGHRPDERGRSPGPASPERSSTGSGTGQPSGRLPRPWQRPPQFQHGFRDNAFGDAEATGALLARIAAVRDWALLPASSTWRRPRSGEPFVGQPGMPCAHDAACAYLGLLDRVLEDRVISDAEVRRLRAVAIEWGIGVLEAERLHRVYITRVWEQAWADGTLTEDELRDIETLAGLLGVSVEALYENERPRAARRWVAVPIEPGAYAGGPSTASAPAESMPPRHSPSGPGKPEPQERTPGPRRQRART